MRNVILADHPLARLNLLPLTFTRPVSYLLTGIITIRQKWEALLPGTYSTYTATAEYLQELFPVHDSPDSLIITSNILPTPELVSEILALKPGQCLTYADNDTPIARRGALADRPTHTIATSCTVQEVFHVYHLFTMCGGFIESDIKRITAGRTSAPLLSSCTLIGPAENLFIEADATVEGAVINVKNGPVYIGHGAEIMEGACLRGPIAIGDHSTVNMGAKIYGPTTIGAHCKVGGELNNVVMHPYSNKAHDGFLGNAVIGSWCNLGAGCTASNLKNDYTEIKLWNYPSRRFLRTGLQFCGLIMGDHSKAGINTMFNTATVTGVGVNIHGTGFPRNFVASFSEGSAAGFSEVPISKFLSIARRVMARRGIELSEADVRMYSALQEITESYR
ncbi:MAG: glucose-1-phosphate thymidylyltransferase [Muribaculaceae bacterium]|nr:glucose-1-phosphate thymidylyltransferase [Muribaculaceae bacterium]